MKKKTERRRGGWPKRDREPVVVRLDPFALAVLTDAAGGCNMSRNEFIATWLEGLAMLVSTGPHKDEGADLIDQFQQAAAALQPLRVIRDESGEVRYQAFADPSPVWRLMRTVADRRKKASGVANG